MNEINKNVIIENLIYEVRGVQVMLDSDLAKLYGCTNGTKTINLAVKRHINRFPERFMFQLSDNEYHNLRFQIETSSLNEHGGRRYNPYVFTEQGVAMLSAVLKTKVAEEISVRIMDAFIAMKKYISNDLLEQKYINNQVMKNTEDIKLLQESFNKLEEKRKNNEIFFKGQIYDAFSLLKNILKEAKENITIIDNYLDTEILDVIMDINVNVKVFTTSFNKNAISKYNKQYKNLTVINTKKFHDRFLIIDNKVLYHCGASFKDLGSKCFSINKIEDKDYLNSLLNIVNNL